MGSAPRPGRVAQLVEQRTFNPQVVGSTPTPVIPFRAIPHQPRHHRHPAHGLRGGR